ncbi:MAG: hypothetical protein V4805_19565, partial [Pseudomonadota bacterium]
MFHRAIFIVLYALALAASAATPLPASYVFKESFNGYIAGSKAAANLSAADKGQLSGEWTDEAYTQIVPFSTVQSYLGLSAATPVSNPAIKQDSIPRTGSAPSALLFRFDTPNGSLRAEQRFKMNTAAWGVNGLSELWMQYDIFIPSNYQLFDDNPTSNNPFGNSGKVLALFADGYSFPNSTLILGSAFARMTPTGAVGYDGNLYNASQLSTYDPNLHPTDKRIQRVYTTFDNFDARIQKWVDVSQDLGHWQRRTLHFKFPTSASAKNGVLEVWNRRANGTVSKIIDVSNGDFYGYQQNYFKAGYLMGEIRNNYGELMHFLIDNVIIAGGANAIDRTAIGEKPASILPSLSLLLNAEAVSPTPVAAPGGVQAVAGQQQVTLSWSPVSAATSYHVYYGTSANLSPTNFGTKLSNVSSPRVVANLSANILYYFVVTAVKGGSESVASTRVSATPSPATTSNASIIYDFAAGDPFVNKSGWAFTGKSGDIKLATVPGSGIKALQFPFAGSVPGTDNMTEQRFTMPPIDSFWIRFRLHIPTNYAHRFDTKIDLPAASIVSWQVGDHVRGVGGVSEGIISGINRVDQNDNKTGIYLRNPPMAWDSDTWVGSLFNLTRNSSAISTWRGMDATNNKLFAVWTD